MRRNSVSRTDLDRPLDSLDDAVSSRTQQRRQQRSRRRTTIIATLFVFCVLLVLSAPSLICVSPYGQTLLATAMKSFGLQAESETIQVGWITPLRVTGLTMTGERAGSTIRIDELQTTITILELWKGGPQAGRFGDVSLRGVTVQSEVDHEWTSIETDLADFLVSDPNSPAITPIGRVTLQDVTVKLIDRPSGATWIASQTHGEATLDREEIRADLAGVLTQPGGGDGAIAARLRQPAGSDGIDGMRFELSADSLPMSILSLAQRRFPQGELPAQVSGDLSGQISVAMNAAGLASVSFTDVQVRDLSATEPRTQRRLWHNQLATLRGDVFFENNRIVAKQVAAATDFAQLQMDGSFSDTLTLAGTSSNPLVWLDRVDATALAEVDLPRFQRAFPELLPLQAGAELQSGRIECRIEPIASGGPDDSINAGARRPSAGRVRRRRLNLHSDVVQARTATGPVRIAPMDVIAVVASDQMRLAAEQFRFVSPFGTIDGQGDLETGSAKIELDFGKFARSLQPILRTSELVMNGSLGGDVKWNAEPDGAWRLRGDAKALQFAVQMAGMAPIRQESLNASVDVIGRWGGAAGGGSLQSLNNGVLEVVGDGVRAKVELVQAISRFTATTPLPVRIQSSGQIASLVALAQPWLPTGSPTASELAGIRGGFDFSGRAEVDASGTGRLSAVDGQINSLDIPLGDSLFHQDLIKLHFDGDANWTSGDVVVRSLSVAGDAASGAIQGEWIRGIADLEIAYRAKLERLQASNQKRVAVSQPNVRPAGFRPTAPPPVSDTSWNVLGDVDGRCVITGDPQLTMVDLQMSAKNLDVRETAPSVPTRSVWFEPNVKVNAKVACDWKQSTYRTDSIELSSDWFATKLAGVVQWDESLGDLRLKGPAQIKMDEVARRLTTLSGTTVVAEGIHQTPLEIMLARGADDQTAFTVISSLGWETADTAGMLFGPTRIPVRMTESTVKIDPSVIPILGPSRLTPRMIGPQIEPLSNDIASAANTSNGRNQGEILLAAQVHYRPALWIEVPPGPIARGVRLTPDLTDKWLKYIAPIASDAARIEGTFGAELDEALIVIDDQRRTRVRGRLNIEQVQMNAGPLADQMIASARQLQALASIGRAVSPPRTGRTLVSLPAQIVEFNVSDGQIQHRALMMEIDRAKVITSGQVGMDGRLNLTAQIPLEASWLGSDLRGLEGQKLTLPIDGTLSRPSLDSAGVRRVVADLGTQAAQQAAGNYLQQQLGRGQQQLEGSLQKGIEKLFGK